MSPSTKSAPPHTSAEASQAARDLAAVIHHDIEARCAAGELPTEFRYYVDLLPPDRADDAVTAPVRITAATAAWPVTLDQVDTVDELLQSIADRHEPRGERLWQVEVDPTPMAYPLERNLNEIHGAVAPLAHTNLSHRDLTGADLVNTDLTGANLREANLDRADLRGARLEHAQLRDSTFVFANARHADFTSAELDGANLAAARLERVNLTSATASGTTLDGADLRFAQLTGCDLTDATLLGADLRGANLTEGTTLTRADLRHAVLSDQRIVGADLTGADLRHADLTRTSFSGCTVTAARIDQAHLEPATRVRLLAAGAIDRSPRAVPPPVTHPPPAPVVGPLGPKP